MEEEEPEIEDIFSETRGRMSNIDKDTDIRFKKYIERNKREESKRYKMLNVSYTTKVTNESVSKGAVTG